MLSAVVSRLSANCRLPSAITRITRIPAHPLAPSRTVAAFLLAFTAAASAQSSYIAYSVTINGAVGAPTITVRNNSRDVQITNLTITIGDWTKNFDSVTGINPPTGGYVELVRPDSNNVGGSSSDDAVLNIQGFDPGEVLSFQVDLDNDGDNGSGGDFRTTFFNNGALFNSTVTARGNGMAATLTMPDGSTSLSSYTFRIARPTRTLQIESLTEALTPVTAVRVLTNGVAYVNTTANPATNLIGQKITINVEDGTTVEIRAPQEVYRDIFGRDITDSILSVPANIDKAEERFTAIGLSVNNVAQTGDPTLYRFDLDQNTFISVKWKHEYALSIDHDFSRTVSQDTDAVGAPWAGPLSSKASGNPVPEAKKNWVKKGDPVIATIDGQVLDFSRPGLDIRYVPVAYSAYGPANRLSNPSLDESNRLAGVDIRTNLGTVQFVVGQSPPQRQQVPQTDVIGQTGFTMSGPAGIRYLWQIQFGVNMHVDDPERAALPKVFDRIGGTNREIGNLEGTFWFEPGAAVVVGSAANATVDPASKALSGWFSGDSYYFTSSGELNSGTGALTLGGPGLRSDNTPTAAWESSFYDASGRLYRGMLIPNLQRAARVIWTYGNQQIHVSANIGEYVFQGTSRENDFTVQPDLIKISTVSGANKNVADSEAAIWDPVANRLYPLVPGKFKAIWRTAGSSTPYEVVVTVNYPAAPHYPHIAGTPPVALDPDPDDNFIFKQLRYTENTAVVDANRRFTATAPGKTVLLFSEIQRVGRGQPREFLRVRVVETKNWNANLAATGTAVIGQKITDSELDKAELGTGYLLFQGARYNPFIYDSAKLEGLAAKDVYDVEGLRSNPAQLTVVNRDKLPGPIIPVNLHPGAQNTQRVVVVWYENPARHDQLLWPHRARVYNPRWPTNDTEGLGRIVIASQFGSESVATNGADQVVVGSVTNIVPDDSGLATNIIPAQVTYNPSRLQQVQIYSQPVKTAPGYNPNEEHALLAPSLRYAAVSPRPPAVYALRANDLNKFNTANPTLAENLENANTYTSHPFVLVQFFDTAASEFRMRVYKVEKEDTRFPNYSFATPSLLVSSTTPRTLQQQPHVVMIAGEPVIPFYPLGEVIGASPCSESFGANLKDQTVYWEDHKGSSWSISGGEDAWFTVSFYYPLLQNFWWPEKEPGRIEELVESGSTVRRARVPQVGDCVAFVPPNSGTLRSLTADSLVSSSFNFSNVVPTRVLYKSDWPEVAPVLKAGETLTFSGGEHRADNPFTYFADADGNIEAVETPGLPGVLAFATAELVFDSLNAKSELTKWRSNWTARVAQVLEQRTVSLSFASFPPELAPATRRTRVKSGKYVFAELPASLQKRVVYDPLNGQLQIVGYLNDKTLGESTLTASPPAVYILEPNIITDEEAAALSALSENSAWRTAVEQLAKLSRNPSLINSAASVPNPGTSTYISSLQSLWRTHYTAVGNTPVGQPAPLIVPIANADSGYLVGLDHLPVYDSTGNRVTIEDPAVSGLYREVRDIKRAAPIRAFGPGLAILPNPGFLDPDIPLPDVNWITVVENNDASLGGAPITVHVIQVARNERYRGAIKTTVSDNVFDENLGLRHTGDFGANADELYFEWWYRPDDGSLNVPPPDLLKPGQPNPWKLFPDPTGNRGKGRYQITLKGNPNAPEALLADTFWFVRYRHDHDRTSGTNWRVPQNDGSAQVNFTWAGAGNSDPFHDFDADGLADYRAQLAQGWIKRVLDAVNPYEARIRSFEGDSPSTVINMLQQFGARFEGPVALNPDKNVIENVGLIELYETILNRARDLSIDLSRPVSTPAIANALQLASTRISDFYSILGNEAYADAVDPTIGVGSDATEPGNVSSSVFSFQNQMSSPIEEELALLRGVDDFFARPVYNRLFWNFTKGEGEAAYAANYNVTDLNSDGFIDEDDAMLLYPQGHGDAWGHYLTAIRVQYELLRHPFFNWVSRSEFYNLQDITIKVDFLDERKFARAAAAKAKVGAEVVNMTYRQKFVADPDSQWQGYSDANKDRSWGVQDWARRAAQGAYFDWVTANALLPSQHPNSQLDGIQKVDRAENADIAVISANLNSIQRTVDDANKGHNPLGIARNAVPFDIDPAFLVIGSGIQGRFHFDQIYERAVAALGNAAAVWENANETQNRLREIGNSEAELRNATFQEDLSYKNQLIAIFGKPYAGTMGSGRLYPAGYDGPDTLLHMYVDVRKIDNTTVPGPAASFATFNGNSVNGGDIYDAIKNGSGSRIDTHVRGWTGDLTSFPPDLRLYMSEATRRLFSPTITPDSSGVTPALARNGLYAVNYTDVTTPKVPLSNLGQLMPVTAAGYTFQAPRDWGTRQSVGELQVLVNQMLQQEAAIASAIGAWDGLQGQIVRTLRLINAKIDMQGNMRLKNELFSRLKLIINDTIKGIEGGLEIFNATKETVTTFLDGTSQSLPQNLPTGGLAISPGDALAPARGGLTFAGVSVTAGISAGEAALRIAKLVAEISIDITENELQLFEKREEDALAVKEMLKEIEDLIGDEPIRRIEIFKEIQALRELSDQYRAKLDEGIRLIDERAAYNKRVAAQTQRERYHDMTFRVARNHAMQNYRSAFDLAARYVYLAARAYDFETNLDPSDTGAPTDIYGDIVRARTLGLFEDEPRQGAGGLSEALARLKANFASYKTQFGINNPQLETGKLSLRTEHFRILPRDEEGNPVTQPNGLPFEGLDSDEIWRNVLQENRVEDLWKVPEFRYYCRPFATETDAEGNHIPEPGIVIRFSSEITAGKNFFGRALGGGDHAYDPTLYSTRINAAGIWFSDYLTGDVLNGLPTAPRAYLIPAGADVMSVATSQNPEVVRVWKVADQRIPTPIAATTSALDASSWIPLRDSLDGRLGDTRKFPMMRAYHDGGGAINTDELMFDSRLVGRSVWNTQWVLIIPGRLLNADPNVGLDRFIEQVSDIKLVFQTYGYSGN